MWVASLKKVGRYRTVGAMNVHVRPGLSVGVCVSEIEDEFHGDWFGA